MQDKLIKLASIIGISVIGIALLGFILSVMLGGDTAPTKKSVSGESLVFWHLYDTTDQIMPLLTQFSEQTGIPVDYRSFSDLTDYRNTLLTELAAGSGPTLFSLPYEWLSDFSRIITPRDDLSPDTLSQTFVPGALSGMTASFPGTDETGNPTTFTQIAGLPLYIDTPLLYYNKALFTNVLARPNPAPGTTWDSVKSDAVSMTVIENGTPTLLGLSTGDGTTTTYAADTLLSLYLQLGGEPYGANGAPQFSRQQVKNGTSTLIPGTAALTLLSAFSRENGASQTWSPTAAAAPDYDIGTFASGRLAMLPAYASTRARLDTLIAQGAPLLPADIGVAPFPQMFTPQSGKPRAVLASFPLLTIAKNTSQDKRIQARMLMDFLLSPSVQLAYGDATGKASATREALAVQQSKSSPLGILATQAIFARALPQKARLTPLLKESLTALAAGTLSPDAAAAQIDAALAQ